MRNTGRKPPILLRWLDADQRIGLAENIRNIASDLAEWIAPELAPEGKPASGNIWRMGGYALVCGAAAVLIAVWAWDASASINLNRPSAPIRATAY